MKIYFVIFCFLINVFCFGQDKAIIKFISKRDSTKIITRTLPLIAKIITKNQNIKRVAIIKTKDSTDSIITALKYYSDKDTLLTNKENTIWNNYLANISLIDKNRQLSKKEKKKKIDSCSISLYIDTIKYKLSDIKKIEFQNDNQSKIAKIGCVSLLLASSMICVFGFTNDVNDIENPSKEEQLKNAIILTIGYVGLGACYVWTRHITFEHFQTKKWNIKIEKI
jgi:hypothetical protein